MMKRSILLTVIVVLFSSINSFGLGSAESIPEKKVERSSTKPRKTSQLATIYILSKKADKNFIEGVYLPQGIAAYYQNQFTMNNKERRIQFEDRYSYRIIKKHLIKEGLWMYSVETSSPLITAINEKTFTLYFNYSALVTNSGEAMQPATYALERGARMSGLTNGMVRIKSLEYNEIDEQFKAVVVVNP